MYAGGGYEWAGAPLPPHVVLCLRFAGVGGPAQAGDLRERDDSWFGNQTRSVRRWIARDCRTFLP